MNIQEFEKKRAANLIWNGARDYTIEPGFRVYDEEGRADVYWNSIIGAIHMHYDWDRLQNFYHTFHETIDQGVYESLFWLALEHAVFEKEKDLRPVFPYLRQQYARAQVDALHGSYSLEDSAGQRLLSITMGHFRRALGLNCNLPDLVDVHLLDAIEGGAGLTTDELIEHLARTFSYYFTYKMPGEDRTQSRSFALPSLRSLFSLRRENRRKDQLIPIRKLSFGYGEHVTEYGSEILDQSHLSVAFAAYTAQTDAGLKEYIQNSFGRPIYDDARIRSLQKEYCYGNHADVKLYFTDGSYTDQMLKAGYAGKMKQEGLAQARKNEEIYESQGGLHRQQIARLESRIRNALMARREESGVYSSEGQLEAARIWRGLYLGEPNVFHKILPGDDGELTVDLLLDASTSQLHRQEVVSGQGYMIAEALTKCGIRTRVVSFCSLNGYTIMNVHRDYGDRSANRNIFRYFTSGANRDGIALRLMRGSLKDNHARHRVLIVLSDAQPNDALKMRNADGVYQDYAALPAVEDTAAEVHAARMDGIHVLCVYTGSDEHLENAARIYQRDFVRIRSLDMFADAVGSLLETQIRTL